MVNLEVEPFNNFSKFSAIVLMLIALSGVIAHSFNKKEKNYLVKKIIK